MRSLRVLRNVVTNYLRFFLAGAIAFVLTPFMVRHLGDRDYGLWVTLFSLTGYFGLFDQGIRPSLVRYVSRDHAAGDRDGLARTISSAFALYSVVAVVTMAVAMVVAVNAASWIRLDASLYAIAPALVMVVGLSIALGFPLGVFGAVLSGLQRYDIANALGMIVGIVRALLFVVVLKMGGGLLALAWASLVMNVLGHAASWVYARRLLPGVGFGPQWVGREHLRRIASYGGYAFIGALATNIAFQTDALVITPILGAALVTPFALASGLVDNARTLVNSAAYVLAPTASELDTLGQGDKLRLMLVAGSRYSVLVSWPVLFGLILFGPNLLTTWVGAKYATAGILLTVLAVPTMVALPQATASSLLFGVSRHKGVVLLSILSAVLNLGLSLWWAHSPGLMAFLFGTALSPGLVGVAMGTAVPLFVVSGVATMVYACHALAQPFWRYFWDGMLHPGLVSLAFVLPAWAVQRQWHPLGWLPILGSCAACWIVFALIAWRFGISASDRARWGQMVPGLFGRKPALRVKGGRP